MPHTISQSLLPEFDHEMANTRKTLERVPENGGDYKPHDKSMSLARLAGHVAEIPTWATLGLTLDEFNMGPGFEALHMTTRPALLEAFDANVNTARAHLAATDDAEMMKMWTFKKGGHTVMSMPKIAVVRSFMLNHLIHHRGQLTVYLRMNGVPVPGLYGPSADEM